MVAEPHHAKLLVVDDEPANVVLLERILGTAGYPHVDTFTDPIEALESFDRVGHDLVCTDLHMPHMNGMELTRAVMARVPADGFLPVIMLTADLSPAAEEEALSSGAQDFVTKPFKASQIRLRVSNLLRTRMLHRALQRHNEQLEEMVLERTIELEAARLDILERLAQAAEYRDYTTGAHTQRVGRLSGLLARQLGLDSALVELVERAAPLHDVGKIGVPDRILLKPGRLSAPEFETMMQHVDVGVHLLSRGQSKLINMAELIALTHHERWDGSGYPRRLRGSEIPLPGQIVAVADVFDTLVSERPYKQAWPLEKAVSEMQRQSGRWFSPALVEALLRVLAANESLIQELEAPAGFGT